MSISCGGASAFTPTRSPLIALHRAERSFPWIPTNAPIDVGCQKLHSPQLFLLWCLRKRGGTAALDDQDLIEMLVHDSVEGFFIGQIEGFATRFLGSRYHRVDEAGNAVGPDYDIYEVINEVRVPGRPLRQRKLYYFDSDTALLGRVQYRLGAERGRGPVEVKVEVRSWGEVFGQLIPTLTVRHEDGVEVVRLEIREAGVAGASEDGSFTLE